MAQFEPYREEIEKARANLVFVAAEKRNGMFKPLEHLAKYPISFPFLFDEDRQVTKSYGVYQRLGVDAINIARPATLVVDKNGIIVYLFVGMSQTSRSPIEEIMSALNAVTTSKGILPDPAAG